MTNWKTHHKNTVFTSGKWLAVEDRTVESPDGQTIEHWCWVTSPDFVNIFAVMEDGRALLFRQGKYGLDGDSLAPMGGYMEPDEQPLAAAKRELLEETGCEAGRWIELGRYIVDPNRGVAWGSMFLALGVKKVTGESGDDIERQEQVLLTLDEVESALLSGQFRVMSWANCTALALIKLRQIQLGI